MGLGRVGVRRIMAATGDVGPRRTNAAKRLALGLLVVTAIAGGRGAQAGSQFYYDALGRQVSSFRPSGQDEMFTLDSTDNRSTVNAFGTTTPSQTGLMQAYQMLLQGQSIVSTDGRFTLAFQQDGNVVLYQGSTVLWQTGTGGRPAAYLIMGASGLLVLFDPQNNVIWESNNGTATGAYLDLLNNGNLVIYSGSTVIWQTNTCCH